jgi:hypothetical protein
MSRHAPELLLFMIGVLLLTLGHQYANGDQIIQYATALVGLAGVLAGMLLTFKRVRTAGPSMVLGESEVASGDLEVAVRQLSANYDLLRRQVSQGFVLAGLTMIAGVFVILAGAFGEEFGLTAKAGATSVVVGGVVEIVSGLGFFLFKQTFNRLNMISDRLHETWRLLAAFKKAQDLPEEKRADVTIRLIELLVAAPPIPAAIAAAAGAAVA